MLAGKLCCMAAGWSTCPGPCMQAKGVDWLGVPSGALQMYSPIVAWAERELGIELHITDSIFGAELSDAAVEGVRSFLQGVPGCSRRGLAWHGTDVHAQHQSRPPAGHDACIVCGGCWQP